MMSRTKMFFTSCCLSAICVTASASFAGDVLKIIPDDVHAAVVISNPDETQASLTKLSGKLGLPIPDLVILGRAMTGLGNNFDSSGNMALILDSGIEGDRSPWSAVWCVATPDFSELQKAMGVQNPDDAIGTGKLNNRNLLVAEKDGYALIAAEKYRGALEHVLEANDPINEVAATLGSRLDSPDLYVLVTHEGIRSTKQLILQGIDALKDQIAQQALGNESAVAGLAMYESLLGRIDEDFTAAMLGLELDDDGNVRFTKSGVHAADGEWKKFSTEVPPTSKELLGTLPDGGFVFAAAGVIPAEMGEYMMSWSMEAMQMYMPGSGLGEKDIADLVAAGQKIMEGVSGMSMSVGIPVENEAIYAGTGFVIQVEDSSAFLKSYAGTIEQMNEVMNRSKNPAFTYKVTPKKFDGREGFVIETDMSGFLETQGVPQTEQMMEVMFGDGGQLRIYMSAAGKKAVVGQYISEENLLTLVRRVEVAGSGQLDSPLTQTMKLLPADAQGYGFWSPSGTFQMIQSVAAGTAGVDLPLPEMPLSLPAGLAVTMSEKRIDVDAVVPFDLIKTVAEYARMVQGMRAAR